MTNNGPKSSTDKTRTVMPTVRTPPYSPDLDPCDRLSSIRKSMVRKFSSNKDMMKQTWTIAIKTIR